MKRPMKKGKKIVISVLAIVVLTLIIGVVRYLTFSMKADDEAIAAMASISNVTVTEDDDYITFTPAKFSSSKDKTALIYYPGGQVEPESFAYAARGIAEEGYMVVIAKMPFNLAMFDYKEAENIVSKYKDVDNWYISGFSLGGVAAAMNLSKNPDPFRGMIFYASYTTDSYDLSKTNLKVKSISGSNDGLSTKEKIENGKQYLPKDAIFYEIEGGNHTQFAIYGDGEIQKGDNKAGIDRIKQQDIVIEETVKFLREGK